MKFTIVAWYIAGNLDFQIVTESDVRGGGGKQK